MKTELYIYDASHGEYSDWSPQLCFINTTEEIAIYINERLEETNKKIVGRRLPLLKKPSMPYTPELVKALFKDWDKEDIFIEIDCLDLDLLKKYQETEIIIDNQEKSNLMERFLESNYFDNGFIELLILIKDKITPEEYVKQVIPSGYYRIIKEQS